MLEQQTDELLAWIGLSRRLQVPLLRVFGGAGGSASTADEAAIIRVASALRALALAAERTGVTLILEAHDAFSSATTVADLH